MGSRISLEKATSSEEGQQPRNRTGKGRMRNRRRESNDDRHEHSTSESNEARQLSLLYMLAKQWAWPAVTFRAQTNPHEASAEIRDEYGNTALHWTAFGNPPLEAVDALIHVCPELAAVRNNRGETPLHVASSYRASGPVIRALVQAYPEATCIMSAMGTYPLHSLCDFGSSTDAIRAILETPQGASTVDKVDVEHGRMPLCILGRKDTYFCVRIAMQRMETVTNLYERHALLRKRYHEVGELWDKATLLIRTMYEPNALVGNKNISSPTTDDCAGGDAKHIGLIRACLGAKGVPPCWINFALVLHPEQLTEKDNAGRLPLHVVASNHDGKVVTKILRSYPDAARIADAEGDFPFNISVRSSRHPSVIRTLLKAHPPALESLDLDIRLYPRILSRFVLISSVENLSVLFQFVTAKPHLFIVNAVS